MLFCSDPDLLGQGPLGEGLSTGAPGPRDQGQSDRALEWGETSDQGQVLHHRPHLGATDAKQYLTHSHQTAHTHPPTRSPLSNYPKS